MPHYDTQSTNNGLLLMSRKLIKQANKMVLRNLQVVIDSQPAFPSGNIPRSPIIIFTAHYQYVKLSNELDFCATFAINLLCFNSLLFPLFFILFDQAAQTIWTCLTPARDSSTARSGESISAAFVWVLIAKQIQNYSKLHSRLIWQPVVYCRSNNMQILSSYFIEDNTNDRNSH